MQGQLACVHGSAQVAVQLHALFDQLRHGLGEEVQLVAPGILGAVHGQVGEPQQGVDVAPVLGIGGDADAGGDKQLPTLDFKGFGQARQQLARGGLQGQTVPRVLDQHGEFVPAQPGHGVARPGQRPQALGHLAQQLVAHRVAVGVVDLLEVVQIDEQQRQLTPNPLSLGDGMAEAVHEQEAVGQPGQHIEVRQMVDALLRQLLLGDVVQDGDVALRPAVGIPYAGQADPQRLNPAVVVLMGDLPLPGPCRFDHLGQFAAKSFGHALRSELTTVSAFHLGRRVAGDAGEGRVHLQDPPVGVHDDDAVQRAGEHAGGQAQLRLGAHTFGQVPNEADEASPPVGQLLHPDAQIEVDLAAVLAKPLDLTAQADHPGRFAFDITLHVGIVPLPGMRRHQPVDAGAQQFVTAVAEQRFAGCIALLDAAALVNDQHGVRRGFQQRTAARQALLQRQLRQLARGNVGDESSHAHRLPPGVAHRLAAALNPEPLP